MFKRTTSDANTIYSRELAKAQSGRGKYAIKYEQTGFRSYRPTLIAKKDVVKTFNAETRSQAAAYSAMVDAAKGAAVVGCVGIGVAVVEATTQSIIKGVKSLFTKGDKEFGERLDKMGGKQPKAAKSKKTKRAKAEAEITVEPVAPAAPAEDETDEG